jgi:hypothetical protein
VKGLLGLLGWCPSTYDGVTYTVEIYAGLDVYSLYRILSRFNYRTTISGSTNSSACSGFRSTICSVLIIPNHIYNYSGELSVLRTYICTSADYFSFSDITRALIGAEPGSLDGATLKKTPIR